MRLIIIRIENNSHSHFISVKKRKQVRKISILTLIFILFAPAFLAANEANIFNARHDKADAELYGKFTKATGIKVNVISGKDKALQKRIVEEGADSKADI